MLPPTHVAEFAPAAAPVLQLVLQGALTLLQAEFVEGLTTHLAIHKLQGKEQKRGQGSAASRNLLRNQLLPTI